MISILIGTGFEEVEAVTVYDILKRAKLDVSMVSVTGSLEVNSVRNLFIRCDQLVDEIDGTKQELVVVPGGMGGVRRIISSPSAKAFLQEAAAGNGLIGAICAGPMVLDKFGILEGHRYTCFPGCEEEIATGTYVRETVVDDGSLITSVSPGTAAEFALALVERLSGSEVREKIEESWYGTVR